MRSDLSVMLDHQFRMWTDGGEVHTTTRVPTVAPFLDGIAIRLYTADPLAILVRDRWSR